MATSTEQFVREVPTCSNNHLLDLECILKRQKEQFQAEWNAVQSEIDSRMESGAWWK